MAAWQHARHISFGGLVVNCPQYQVLAGFRRSILALEVAVGNFPGTLPDLGISVNPQARTRTSSRYRIGPYAARGLGLAQGRHAG